MSVALLGLLLLQFYWIRNVHQLTQDRFNESVKESLEMTAADLEKLEAARLIQPELFEQGLQGSYADFVNTEFGDVMRVDESIEIRDTVISRDGEKYRFLVVKGTTIDTVTGLLAEHRVITKNLGDIMPSDFESSLLSFQDSNSFAIELDNSFEQQIMLKAQFLNEMMVKMFTGNYFDDISLRLNLVVLDSILTKNIKRNNVDTSFTFNVLDENGNNAIFAERSKNYDPGLKNTAFTTLLYPNDIVEGGYQLLISFPEESIYLWREMTGTILGSFLLVLIIVFAFFLSVITIQRQKKLSEIKNDFISNMTHELKTPISTISLACQAIKDPDVSKDGETLGSFVSMIDQENQRLEKLVEKVLQSALLDKGKMKLNKTEIRVDELVKNVVDAVQIRFRKAHGEIVIDQLDQLEAVVDKVHFSNIIYNLLDNALKYSAKNPVVHIALKARSTGFTLRIKDNGIGIKKEDQKRIFEKLYRVPTGDVHNVKGFGLGLNYVQSIVDLHNGKITVESGLGKGSTFKIRIENE